MQQLKHNGRSTYKPYSDRRLTEIEYHKRFLRRVVCLVLPSFIGFAIFYGLRESYLQMLIFLAMAVNAVGAVAVGYKISDLDKLILSKQIGSAIGFGLLGGSIIAGLLSDDIYISLPWIYIFPISIMLFFGDRLGLYCSIIFCILAITIVVWVQYPSWTKQFLTQFRINAVASLVIMMGIGYISERTRVRIRNQLINARNQSKAAEKSQRDTNAELKSEIELRIQSEKALLQSEARYRILFEESSISQWEENYTKIKEYLDDLPQEAADNLGKYFDENPEELAKCINWVWITAVNRATLDLYGAENIQILLENIWLVLPPNTMKYMAERFLSLYHTGRYSAQVTGQTLSGSKLYLLVVSKIPAGFEDSWEKVFSSVYDVTQQVAIEKEKKRVDQQMQHTRQIQAVASLAGGIAHQFNNALAIIVGNLDLLELNLNSDSENGRFIGALRAASTRIGMLTEQLLAYAQGGKYQPKDFIAQDFIEAYLKKTKILQETSVSVTTQFEPGVAIAGSDGTQIQIVLESVLSNAVEAMPYGGEIIISTQTQCIENDPMVKSAVLAPGWYAVICIEDQGVGMDRETQRRIFEPFFSTKFVGRGLGMAAAYGIVKNHDGTIEVHSEPKKGTRVTIFLPSIIPSAQISEPESSDEAA